MQTPIASKVFSAIEQDLNQPAPEQPNPQLQLEQQKLNIEQEKNLLKSRELDIKEAVETAKTNLTAQEMKLQNSLKIQQLADERKKLSQSSPVVVHDKQPIPVTPKKVDTNIATGMVKGF